MPARQDGSDPAARAREGRAGASYGAGGGGGQGGPPSYHGEGRQG